MKIFKTYIKALCFISLVSFSSCDDFLEETSQDEIIPETLEDLTAVMYAEAYPYSFAGDVYLNLLTDEIKSNGLSYEGYTTKYENGRPIFTYDVAMFDGGFTIPGDANSWELYYERIMGCNVIIDYVETIEATDAEKLAMRGQALFLRGYYYFKLATIYCQPYNLVDPTETLGLPLVLTMEVTDDFPSRASLEETYTQIENDLKEAAVLLKENYEQPNKYRVGYLTAEAILTRFYTLKCSGTEWQKVIDYSDDVLAYAPILTNLSSFESTFHSNGIYTLDVSDEPLWVYGVNTALNSNYWPSNAYNGIAPYSIASELTALYEVNDLRAESYFSKQSTATVTYDYNINKIGQYFAGGYGDRGIRNAEVYLNRAEAYCRLFVEAGDDNYRLNALSDLNTLRESRFATGTYEDVNITDANELLDFCLTERRRELCLEEGLRWADIKRLNLSIDHVFIDENGTESTYTLKSGDKLYALPIPYNVINRNSNLSQNPR